RDIRGGVNGHHCRKHRQQDEDEQHCTHSPHTQIIRQRTYARARGLGADDAAQIMWGPGSSVKLVSHKPSPPAKCPTGRKTPGSRRTTWAPDLATEEVPDGCRFRSPTGVATPSGSGPMTVKGSGRLPQASSGVQGGSHDGLPPS